MTFWIDECDDAFSKLKERLTSAPVLGHPDLQKAFILEVDSSFRGLGAVLSQQQDDRRVVLGYASRSLRDTEKKMNNYSSMKVELLAPKWAITEKFRDLLIGSEFVVYTDNNPLSYVQTTGKLGATETRWLADLAQFQFTIKYRSGRANQNADSLRRKTRHGDEPILANFDQVIGYQTSQEGSTVIPARVREAMENTLGDVWCENVHTEKSRVITLMATQAISTLPSIPKTTLRMLQRSDPVLARVWHHWDTHTRPTSVTMRTEAKPVRKILYFWQQLSKKDGVLYRTIELNRQPVEQLLLPACMHREVLCALHDDIGHQSPEKTLALARTRCYWSGIVQDITEYYTADSAHSA